MEDSVRDTYRRRRSTHARKDMSRSGVDPFPESCFNYAVMQLPRITFSLEVGRSRQESTVV